MWFKLVWGVALWMAQPRKFSMQKKGRGNLSLLLATGIVSAQERGTLVLFLCSLH